MCMSHSARSSMLRASGRRVTSLSARRHRGSRSPTICRNSRSTRPTSDSPLLVPLVGRLLAVAGALGPDARHVLRRAGGEDLLLRVRHLALRAAGRPVLAEALHPAEETVHGDLLPGCDALTPPTALIVGSSSPASLPAFPKEGEEMRSIRRPLALSGAILGLTLFVPLTHLLAANSPGSRPAVPCPSFAAANFRKPTTIDNPYFPLAPGTRFTYQGAVEKTPVVDIVTVTHTTPTIDGVKTSEVRDQVFDAGVLTEELL